MVQAAMAAMVVLAASAAKHQSHRQQVAQAELAAMGVQAVLVVPAVTHRASDHPGSMVLPEPQVMAGPAGPAETAIHLSHRV